MTLPLLFRVLPLRSTKCNALQASCLYTFPPIPPPPKRGLNPTLPGASPISATSPSLNDASCSSDSRTFQTSTVVPYKSPQSTPGSRKTLVEYEVAADNPLFGQDARNEVEAEVDDNTPMAFEERVLENDEGVKYVVREKRHSRSPGPKRGPQAPSSKHSTSGLRMDDRTNPEMASPTTPEQAQRGPSIGDQRLEYSPAQLQHQFRLDSKADRLSKILRGDYQKLRSGRIQRRAWARLSLYADLPSWQLARDPARDEIDHVTLDDDAKKAFEGSTSTLLRQQMFGSRGAVELQRTMRVAFTGEVESDESSPIAKPAKTVSQLQQQPWMREMLMARMKEFPNPRYDSTLMSNILAKIRANGEMPHESLLWTALDAAASAHSLEAVKDYLQSIDIGLREPGTADQDTEDPSPHFAIHLPEEIRGDDPSESLFRSRDRAAINPSLPAARLASLLRSLRAGLSTGSVFTGKRNPEALLEILDDLSASMTMTVWKAAFSQWHILYPYINLLSECSAGARIHACWDALWGHCQDDWNWRIWMQLRCFFVHMLFRAGDPGRAWHLYRDVQVHWSTSRETSRSLERQIMRFSGSLKPALIAHATTKPELGHQGLQRDLNRAICNYYTARLKAIEQSLGIRWVQAQETEESGVHGYHQVLATEFAKTIDAYGRPPKSVPHLDIEKDRPRPETKVRAEVDLRSQTFGSGAKTPAVNRPCSNRLWPAVSQEIESDILLHERGAISYDVCRGWEDLPRVLSPKEKFDATWITPNPVRTKRGEKISVRRH